MNDVNNPTGSRGLIAIDKRGCRAIFLDPGSFEEITSIELPARPHEVAISADHRRAYVSIYGNGVYGNNTEPGHEIVVLDLAQRCKAATLDTQPYRAPHGLMFGTDGTLYASCDHSGVVAALDVEAETVIGAIDVGSRGPHMIAMLPDGAKLYSENEEDPFVSFMSPSLLERIGTIETPGGSAGIVATPDGERVLVVHAQEPLLTVIDAHTDEVVDQHALPGHRMAAQRVRCSPDGQFVMVTATEEPLVTILSADLQAQHTLEVAAAPMGVAFHADGRTALVGNHGAGLITVVDLREAKVCREFACGVGVETLAFY
jgi:DNA-binding beta-propeller fold protein YncE